MRVLVVKMSSMGDILHALPALTDAARTVPGVSFDWVAEAAFQEIPNWHFAVRKVMPVSLRAWRKQPFSAATRQSFRLFCQEMRAEKYDLIIDAQGLAKSALLACFARGRRAGPTLRAAREPIAALLYHHRIQTERRKQQHAVTRLRQLFAGALGYVVPTSVPDYGIDRQQLADTPTDSEKYLVLLHGTTWKTKHWPEHLWVGVARLAGQAGFRVKFPAGNAEERARAQRMAALAGAHAEALPPMCLQAMAGLLAGAAGAVAVDTGLGHLAAALGVPCVSLYGPTSASLSGALGKAQLHVSASMPCAPCLARACRLPDAKEMAGDLQPPCMAQMTSMQVWQALNGLWQT